jgi:hypothetical protein
MWLKRVEVFEALATIVSFCELIALNHCSHCAIEDKNTLFE